MLPLFNVACYASAAVVYETIFATEYVTVIGGQQVTKTGTVTAAATTAPLPATTIVTIPAGDNTLTYTLTYDSSEHGYEVAGFGAATSTGSVSAPAGATTGPATTSEASVPNFEYTQTDSSTTAAPQSSSTPSSTSSSAAPATSSDASLSAFANECLSYHNQVRQIHQVGPLEWNTTLADYAQNYLENVANCNFAHSGGPYGENIAMGYSTATAAMQAWYDENTKYDYSAGQFSSDTGHFTQMVWKNTHQLGCYQYDCPSSGNYLVCEYADERGNIIGYFTQNVFPAAS